MSNYVLGAGLHGLILGHILRDMVIGSLDGQSSNPFPLGPRILHYDIAAKTFLNSLGIYEEPKIFNIGHFEGDLITGKLILYPDDMWKQLYNLKARGIENTYNSAMSSGKRMIIGWDIEDIQLYEKLKSKVTIYDTNVDKVLTDSKFMKLSDGTRLKYDSLYNTIKLPIFKQLIGAPKLIGLQQLIANDTLFIHGYSNSLNILFSQTGCKYIYFESKKLPFNRITFTNNDGRVVLEVPQAYFGKDIKEVLPDLVIEKQTIIKQCQIISPRIDINEVNNIKMFGRYAKWNQSILLNDTIKGGYEYVQKYK